VSTSLTKLGTHAVTGQPLKPGQLRRLFKGERMQMNWLLTSAVALIAVLALALVVAAQQKSLEEEAKKTQNPVGEQIKVQIENYFNSGMGPNSVTQYVQHVIPTIPFKLTDSWSLIARTDLPVINQPSAAPGEQSAFGIGDVNSTLYLVPRAQGAFNWGLGPAFTFPTATANVLGSGSWSGGPAVVLVGMHDHWVFGTRINNEWSFAGRTREFNQMWILPFVHYDLRNGWYLASLPSYTANWKASSGNIWTVPVGGGLGKHWRAGRGGIDAQVQVFSNVKRPAGTSDWQFFFEIEMVHPK
jgi:hypothetical protein